MSNLNQIQTTATTKRNGFTIVELLIVIVVIAILAAISVVAYSGIQARTRDAIRVSDANNIIKALESYRVINGQFPAATPGCWERSDSGSFMEYINADYGLPTAPLDPTNDSTYYYAYCRYPASSSSCAATGHYVVFAIKNLEGPDNITPSNWSCGTRNWYPEFDWSWGSFE